MQRLRIARKISPEHNGHAPTREHGQQLIEVHVAGACVRYLKGRWKLLAAKRTFPGWRAWRWRGPQAVKV
jgi:hypothetical protein